MKFACLLMTVLSLAVCGCSKKAAPVEPQSGISVDHVVNLKTADSQKVVSGVFSVRQYAQFEFEVPAHQGFPRLHGDFQSFTKRRAPDSTSDNTADVGVMLLNEQEFADFQQGRPGSTTYQLNPTHEQIVDWQVPHTLDEPEQYHLVFSNSDRSPKTKFVKANFSLSYR